MEKRYEKKGQARPCFLKRDGQVNLARMIQEDLPDRIHDLSFWIEGWGQKTRFDKTIFLDFSSYSVQLEVEGSDRFGFSINITAS